MTLKSLITFFLQTTLALTLTHYANANDLFASQDDEFLPVEKAYQAVLSTEGDQFSVNWSVESGYYLYQHRFKVEARNSEGKEKLALTFAEGKEKYDEYFNETLTVYYDSTTVTSTMPQSISPPYELIVRSQGCADAGLCYPPRKQFFLVDEQGNITEQESAIFKSSGPSTPIQYSEKDASASNNTTSPSSDSDAFLPFILLGALLGGMILNLMPCVFPVLSLKALSFASSSHLSVREQHLHGWAYTAGAIASFVLAALVILLGREAGEALGWGFQLQHPVFVAFMIYLFFIMGLSLSGLVEIGTQWMGAGQSLTTGHGLKSSFFTGVLAAVVASPCTAPFMASALGFALTQSIPVALLVFVFLGLGMALPFLLLSYAPSLAKLLPPPGAWMDTLKQVLAFPLYATCVWLLWVLGHQASSDGAAAIVLGGVFIAFALWLIKLRPKSNKAIWTTKTFALASSLTAIFLAIEVRSFNPSQANSQWQAYSPEKLQEYRSAGTPVFVDLTADWCITCKFNERVALNTDKVKQKAEESGFVMLAGDWTNSDPQITELLNQFGRSGVPLYLVYPAKPDAEPEILPQILTTDIVIRAMERAL